MCVQVTKFNFPNLRWPTQRLRSLLACLTHLDNDIIGFCRWVSNWLASVDFFFVAVMDTHKVADMDSLSDFYFPWLWSLRLRNLVSLLWALSWCLLCDLGLWLALLFAYMLWFGSWHRVYAHWTLRLFQMISLWRDMLLCSIEDTVFRKPKNDWVLTSNLDFERSSEPLRSTVFRKASDLGLHCSYPWQIPQPQRTHGQLLEILQQDHEWHGCRLIPEAGPAVFKFKTAPRFRLHLNLSSALLQKTLFILETYQLVSDLRVKPSVDPNSSIISMAPASNEEQFKFLISCIRYSNNGKVRVLSPQGTQGAS